VTNIVAVAGPIGAGKSAVADRIARVLGAPRRSFGGAVRGRALELGIPTDRESLQTLGDQMIATEGWDAFCRRVVGDVATTVVVDGVRHIGALDALARIAAGGHFAIVFIEAAPELCRYRVAERDGTSGTEFDAANSHPNEREVPLVKQRTDPDLVLANDTAKVNDLDSVADRAVVRLQRRGIGAVG